MPRPVVCASSLSLLDVGTFVFSSLSIPQTRQQVKQHSLQLSIVLFKYNFASTLTSSSFYQPQVIDLSDEAADPVTHPSVDSLGPSQPGPLKTPSLPLVHVPGTL